MQAATEPDAGGERPWTAADGPNAHQNLFLLDAPMPMSATLAEGAEPTVLADRLGSRVWVAYHGGGLRSMNDGATWSPMANPFAPIPFDGWGLAQDDAGSLYAAVNERAVVEAYRSDDGGRTWHGGAVTTTLPRGGIVDVSAYADRAWVAARGAGEVMVIYWAVGTSLEEACVRSTNGGIHWMDRDPMFGPPLGGRPVFGDDGTFAYVSDGILHRYAGADLTGSRCRASPDDLPLFPGGLGETTFEDVSFANGAYFSTAPTAENMGIQLSGVRGDGPAKVVTLPTRPLARNVMPSLSAHGDEIAVAWYGTETPGDFQSSEFQGWWNVYVARVRGFWSDAPEIVVTRLTPEPNHKGPICLGGISCGDGSDRDLLDYLGLDHARDGVTLHVAYTHDGTTDTSYVRYAKLT